jgi:hypothetical protein
MRDLDRDYITRPMTLAEAQCDGRIKAKARELAQLIYRLVPGSREQSTSLSRLEEVTFWATAGLMRNTDRCPFCGRSPLAPAAFPDLTHGPDYCTHSSHNPEGAPVPAWANINQGATSGQTH